jgi:Icc protein
MLVQLSDPHLRRDDDRAADALARAVEAVLALDPAPDAVLLSGDLVDDGAPGSYARARELLAPLDGLPLHVLPGNHDEREALRNAFALGGAAGEPLIGAAACGDLRLVLCDTVVAGEAGGALGADRLERLAAELAAGAGTPTVLAMHHPPALTGVRAMDAIALAEPDRRALAGLLAANPQVQLVTCGHAHRAMVSSLAGRPVLVCPSVFLQLDLALGAGATRDHRELALVAEPPAFAIHILLDGVLSSHVQPIGDFGGNRR